MKISKQERILIVVFLVAAIIGVGIFVFILPNFNKISDNNKQLASVNKQYADINKQLEHESTIDNEISQAYEDGKNLADKFFNDLTEYEADEIMRKFIANGKDITIDGLTISPFSTQALSVSVFSPTEVTYPLKDFANTVVETPDKEKYPMAGIIRGTGYNAGKLQRFGYMSVKAVKNTMLADKNQSFRAHEFHYWNSDCPGSDYEVIKASDNSTASAGYGSDTLYAGFPHIYFYGNENVAERFMDACMKYKKNSRQEAELIPELDKIKGINRDAVMKAKAHWNGIAKPLHGLGLMEEIITQIVGIQNTVDVHIDKRAVIVMCADNGIVEEGVTQTGQDVTAVVSCNMADGISSVCRMAACSKTDVIPVNIGIAADKLADGTDVGTYKGLVNRRVMTGTRNFLKEPAMSQEQLIQAVHEGIKQVEWCSEQGYNILATGEMGIGNTTTSTALASILLNLEPEAVTGRGAGLDDSGLKRKVEVIAKAKEMYGRYADNPLKLLQSIGGLDIAGLVGVYIGGAVYGIPVVADGVIATVAALIAVKMQPEINDYIIVSHQGKEPAMKALLDSLGMKAVIHAELALGEGTGAVMMFPLLDMALQVYRENTTFDDIQIAAYEDYGKC